MKIKWKSKIILFALEAAYGVDPAPTGAANAILMTGVTFSPMEGEDISRDLEYPYLSAQEEIPAGLHGRIRGRIELAPSGTAGTAPAWGPVLRACGVAETITALTSVTYNPITDGMESGTLHFWMGGTRHVLTGCRGNATMRWPAQGLPYLEIDLMGLWSKPAETARPAVDLSAFKGPVVVTHANTPTFTVDGVSLVMREAALSLNNQVETRLLVGEESVIIPDRAEGFTARVEAVPLATFDPYALAEARTRAPVALTHGTTAGNTASLSVPTAQIKRLSGFENAQNILEWPLDAVPLPQAGNDQWTLTLT